MRDEIDARIWAEHHEHFSESLANFVATLAEGVRITFCKLHKIEFAAPWRKTEEQC